MKSRFYRSLIFLLCTVILCSLICIPASADMGPKASVHIDFKNMGDELCFGTLLSEHPSTGPSSAWNGDDEYAYHNENERCPYAPLDYKTWKKFVDYEDADGYYFLQENVYKVSETKDIHWGYYPPDRFKILLYYPETDTFVVSDVCERYAFDTYYTVDMDGVNIGHVDYDDEQSNNDRLVAFKSYRWASEAISLVIRIILTIIIELAIALLFGFRQKKPLIFLCIVNSATQIALNLLLNFINFRSGPLMFALSYINLEFLVFAIEAILYCIFMNRYTPKPRRKITYVMFSFVANLVSFISGLVLAALIPSLF